MTQQEPRIVRVVAGAWIRKPLVLAALRHPDRARGGVWELPGGKVEPGETDPAALTRELSEELGVQVTVGALVAETVHDYGEIVVHLLAYTVACDQAPRALDHAELRWVSPTLQAVDWAPADRPLVAAVAAMMEVSC